MLGIFDSGLGGLTVLKAIQHRLPEYQLAYLGDTARLPYGNRSAELVYRFTVEGVAYLLGQGCPLVIVACNTASALALRRLQREWLPEHFPDCRVLGVIRPVAELVGTMLPAGPVGVVGTRATVDSLAYVREINAVNPRLSVIQQACPLLVPMIEEGWAKRPETARLVREYVRPLQESGVLALVLGCTHYPLLRSEFCAAMDEACLVPDPAAVVADKLSDYLNRHPEIAANITRNRPPRFFVTERTQRFANLAGEWLGRPVELEQIALEKSLTSI